MVIWRPALPGYSFGLGFAVRTHEGLWRHFAGSVGQFFLERDRREPFFWIDPKEELFAVLMAQGPGPARNILRHACCEISCTRRLGVTRGF